jgi:hypothetical protein
MRKSNKLFNRIYEELEKSGIVSDVCAKLGVSRQTYYRWQKVDPKFFKRTTEAQELGVQFVNDIAKSNIISLIQRGDYKASTYWLNNRDYGFRKSLQHLKPRYEDAIIIPRPFDELRIKVIKDKQVPDDPEEDEVIIPKENTINDSEDS